MRYVTSDTEVVNPMPLLIIATHLLRSEPKTAAILGVTRVTLRKWLRENPASVDGRYLEGFQRLENHVTKHKIFRSIQNYEELKVHLTKRGSIKRALAEITEYCRRNYPEWVPEREVAEHLQGMGISRYYFERAMDEAMDKSLLISKGRQIDGKRVMCVQYDPQENNNEG